MSTEELVLESAFIHDCTTTYINMLSLLFLLCKAYGTVSVDRIIIGKAEGWEITNYKKRAGALSCHTACRKKGCLAKRFPLKIYSTVVSGSGPRVFFAQGMSILLYHIIINS